MEDNIILFARKEIICICSCEWQWKQNFLSKESEVFLIKVNSKNRQ